jgi:hypothetical protein
MSRRVETISRKQSRRVAAWIYAVINPVINGLQREQLLLDAGSLTWRPHTRQCELIRSTQEYVDSGQWPNYQDFVAEHPKSPIVPAIENHDSTLQELNSLASKLFDWMLSDKSFVEASGRAFQEYEEMREHLGPQAPILTHTRPDIPKMLAEFVINNVQTLPSHYVIAALWNSTGKSLLSFRDHRQFTALLRSKDSLAENSAKLKRMLEDFRLQLSREFDVPAAPVAGVTFEE